MTTLYISYKNVLRTLISGCLLCSGMAYGQNSSDEVLDLIEQNNTQIIAAQKTLSATIMDNKTGLNLKNPEVEFEHKWNTRNPGEKGKEVSVTQELEWSVISGQKKQLARTKNELAEISFRQTRNAVLLEAQKKLIEISFCNRMLQELNTQLTDADSLVSIYETLLRNGSGNVLDVNRSKLNRAAIATEIRNTNAQKEVLLQDLYGLNGGNTVSLSPEWSLSPLALPENFDSWFQQMEASVPELNYYPNDLALKKTSVRAPKSEMVAACSVGSPGGVPGAEPIIICRLYGRIYRNRADAGLCHRHEHPAVGKQKQGKEKQARCRSSPEYGFRCTPESVQQPESTVCAVR